MNGERFSRSASSRYIGPFAVALAVLVLVVSELGFTQLEDISDERADSVVTQLTAGRLRRALLFMESSQRGFLLTGKDEYLTPYKEQEAVLERTLAEGQRVAKSEAEQRDELVKLIELARRKQSELREVLRLHASGDPDAALNLMLTDLGQVMMAEISALADDIIRQEAAYQTRSSVDRDAVFLYSRAGIWVLVVVCIGGAFVLMRLGQDQERERRVHLQQLLAERDQLDAEVNRRTEQTVELAQHMERVREDERARLARELHDELGGLLTAAKLDVARIRRRIVDDTGTQQALLTHLGQTLDAGISVKRNIIEDLRPSSLSNLGLARTLQIQCSEFSQRAELPVHDQIEDLDLSPDRALAVYRLVQEALTNVAKYAGASEVHVVLRRVGDQAEVRVEDDGAGFDPDKAPASGGHGLQGMRFRIRACGGDVQIRSALGQGTTVQAFLPLDTA